MSAPPPLSWAWAWPHLWNAQVQSWRNCAVTILQRSGDQTNPLATRLEWLCPAVPVVWRGAWDQLSGAGSTCETRQEAAGSSRQRGQGSDALLPGHNGRRFGTVLSCASGLSNGLRWSQDTSARPERSRKDDLDTSRHRRPLSRTPWNEAGTIAPPRGGHLCLWQGEDSAGPHP